jgi:hypothetical protein
MQRLSISFLANASQLTKVEMDPGISGKPTGSTECQCFCHSHEGSRPFRHNLVNCCLSIVLFIVNCVSFSLFSFILFLISVCFFYYLLCFHLFFIFYLFVIYCWAEFAVSHIYFFCNMSERVNIWGPKMVLK